MDESGFDLNIQKEHGWELKSKRLKATKSGKRGKRVSVIGAIGIEDVEDYSKNSDKNNKRRLGKLISPIEFEGHTNKDNFMFWLEEFLLPSLKEKSVIIMDNASFHKGDDVEELIESKGHKLEYLPPYSPDLNPIERKWSAIKTRFRKLTYYFKDKMELLDMVLMERKYAMV